MSIVDSLCLSDCSVWVLIHRSFLLEQELNKCIFCVMFSNSLLHIQSQQHYFLWSSNWIDVIIGINNQVCKIQQQICNENKKRYKMATTTLCIYLYAWKGFFLNYSQSVHRYIYIYTLLPMTCDQLPRIQFIQIGIMSEKILNCCCWMLIPIKSIYIYNFDISLNEDYSTQNTVMLNVLID